MHESADVAAILREHPHFAYPSEVRGPLTSLRRATASDAALILSLRLDPAKNAFLSETPPDIDAQRRWLSVERNELYFIIETDHPVGTVRLYDQRGTSFSWGSWILADDAPKGAAVETMRMVYMIGLDLGFTASHFEVRKGNANVWQFHERMGAERVGEDELNFYYRFDKGEILSALKRFDRGAIKIEW